MGHDGRTGVFLHGRRNWGRSIRRILLKSKMNMGSVSVRRVTSKGGEAQLKGLLSDHVSLTGSIKATRLLEDWDNSLKKFWQVIPASEEGNPAVVDGTTGVAASSEATTPLVASR